MKMVNILPLTLSLLGGIMCLVISNNQGISIQDSAIRAYVIAALFYVLGMWINYIIIKEIKRSEYHKTNTEHSLSMAAREIKNEKHDGAENRKSPDFEPITFRKVELKKK